MKLEDCKKGQLVLATKKSCSVALIEEFLRVYPLGVTHIRVVDKDRKVIKIGCIGYHFFIFAPDDLILLEDINNV